MEFKDIIFLIAFGFIMWQFLKKPDKDDDGWFLKTEVKIKERRDK